MTDGSSDLIQILPMASEDADSVARLSGQLGYPVLARVVRENFSRMRERGCDEVLIAKIKSETVGWIHLVERHSLSTGPRCELGGLVVDAAYRGLGIGTRLMEEAEAWAKGRRLEGLRFTSRESREDAHRFYERLGYRIEKTSHVFAKGFTSH